MQNETTTPSGKRQQYPSGPANGKYIHGHTKSPTYGTWKAMRQRCSNKNVRCWDRYGGRGITVCERWANSFSNFLADMGEKPTGKTLDRKDNSLGYFKENCKWSTCGEQARNRRNNVVMTVNGVTGCLADLCRRFGVRRGRVWHRIFKFGWSPEQAFSTPKRKNQWA